MGRWLFEQLTQRFVHETDGWAADRMDRVAAQLQQDRPLTRLIPVVLQMKVATAFTTAGPYVYISRRLLERCPDDDCAAMLFAHELAHHDLGHFEIPDWVRRANLGPNALRVAQVASSIVHRINSAEREGDADRHAMRLCVDAGYDPERCLYLFRLLEQVALDYRDIDGVFGWEPEFQDDGEPVSPIATAWTHAQTWLSTQQRGYWSLRQRASELREYVRQSASRA